MLARDARSRRLVNKAAKSKTAAGDRPGAEALSGLARAFFYAGARSLVVSHWNVDSEATVTLMDGLFAALKANPGLSHAEALRLAMLRMIGNHSKSERAQPSFWAPFVIACQKNQAAQRWCRSAVSRAAGAG
jgi:CHAT domain-containing protein